MEKSLNYRIEDDALIISLGGRLDAESVERIEREMIEISKENPHTSLHIDATDLEYISSSGLRIILKCAKAEKDFYLENVCENVYNVFAMTGFTRIMNISKALRRINLDECEKIGSGSNGAIYRISEDEIVKVNYNPVTYQTLNKELAKAKEAFLLGVPTAISFDIVDCGDGRKGLVYETIKSITLGETIQKHPERMEELTERYVEELNALHSIHTDNPIFGSAKELYRIQVENTVKYLTEEEGKLLYRILDVLPDGDRLVHCDAHPKNLMVKNNDMMWIDMEQISTGHPIYDLISIAVILKGMKDEEIARGISGMDIKTLNAMNDCFIRKYFKTDDPVAIEQYNNVFTSMRLIRSVFAIGFRSRNTELLRPQIIAMAREVFFPNIENIIAGLQGLISSIR